MIDAVRLGRPWPLSNAPERPHCAVCKGHMTMDIKSILFELRAERDSVDAAIAPLERIEDQYHRGPGRLLGSRTKAHTNGTGEDKGSPKPTFGER
jgi:hypothetical protein